MQDGALVAEWYAPEGAPDRTHAVMSVSKSVVGCIVAALVDRDLLDTDQLVTEYIPELAASGYADATVRHVLDMRSGVRFREDYLDPEAEVAVLARWIGPVPLPGETSPPGMYRYLAGLSAEAPHGQRFLYRSAETDVLGWVCERAAGKPMAELISTLIWQPSAPSLMLKSFVTGWALRCTTGACAQPRGISRGSARCCLTAAPYLTSARASEL